MARCIVAYNWVELVCIQNLEVEGLIMASPDTTPASWVLEPTMSMTEERENDPVVV